MEIQALTLFITEQDLNDLAARHQPDDSPVEDLRFRVTAEGLHISGEYPLFLKVTFETLWELGIRDGHVTARLARLKALGLPITVFKSMLLKLVQEAAGKGDWLHVEDETIIVNLDRWLVKEGVPLRTNLSAIRCQEQSLVVVAGRAQPGQVASPADGQQNSE
jgi:hypothetical protein